MRGKRKTALDNIDLVFKDAKTKTEKINLAKKAFSHIAISIVEFFRISNFMKKSAGRVNFSGLNHLDDALKKGNGIVLVISHVGSWEYLAFLPFLKKYKCSVIVKSTRNKYLFKLIQFFREMTELKPIEKNSSVREIFKELKANNVVAILIDQWAGNEGIKADFFGVPTSTTSIPARLAIKTKAALVPAYCFRLGREKFEIVIKPAIKFETIHEGSEKEITEALNRQLEKEIVAHEEQWIWGHRRWKPLPESLRN